MIFLGNLQRVLLKRKSVQLAELMGILLGDGSLYHNQKHKIYQCVITGHSRNDYQYLVNFVKPLFEDLFDIRFRVKKLKTANAIQVYNQNKAVTLTLQQLGIPIGNKKNNNVKIPQWIFDSKTYLRACIRGLMDTDGSVSALPGRNYPYLYFNSSIRGLRESFSQAMKILGFKIAKWSLNRGAPQTFIAKKSLVHKYAKEVGFNNPYHKNRFSVFNAPVV